MLKKRPLTTKRTGKEYDMIGTLIGLTGNMACGKSTVAALLSRHPAITTLDCDRIARDILTSHAHDDCIQAIVGYDAFTDDRIDLHALADTIFTNHDIRRRFESFLHPLVWNEITRVASTLDAGTLCIVESAILFEHGWNNRFDAIVTVTCSPEEQQQRLSTRNTHSVQERMKLQLPSDVKERRSDYVIDTQCAMEELERRVAVLAHRIIQRFEGGKRTMNTTAVYAGSFDPPTMGHQWMIEKTARMFSKVVIAIGVNPAKKSAFTLDERVDMLRDMTAGIANVQVAAFEHQYLVRYAESIGAEFIIRGIRNIEDYEYERTMRNINSDLNPFVTTIVLMPPRDIAEISSSTVKGLVGPDGWERVVARYVPTAVLKKLIIKHSTLWTELTSIGAVGDEQLFWDSVLSPYFESNRLHHTWFHIADVCSALRRVHAHLQDPIAVAIAAVMHDIVQNALSMDEEEQSAARSQQLLHQFGLPTDFIERVSHLIRATKHGMTVPEDADARYLIDADLLVLAASPREYRDYSNAIRQEYAWVPEHAFATERLRIVDMFLNRPAIFCTDHFRALHEADARRNLEHEREELRRRLHIS